MGWYERLARWSEKNRFLMDLGGALALALVVVGPVTGLSLYGTDRDGGTVGPLLWAAAVIAPLPWARIRPVAATVAVYAAALGHMLTGYPLVGPADLLAVPYSLYTLTVYGPRWAYRTGVLSAMAGSVAVGLSLWWWSGETVLSSVPVMIFSALVFLAVFAFALVRRGRRTMLVAMQERAVRLEIERDQQAQIATAAERARIAREMHDIVAHSLSVVIAQADGGRYAAANDPEAATRALGTIAETGRAALTEMRRLLGVLREDAPGSGTSGSLPAVPDDGGSAPAVRSARSLLGLERVLSAAWTAAPGPTSDSPAVPEPAASAVPAPLTPQPDVTEIEQLVDQIRESGVRVSFVRIGAERHLPPGIGLTLYRVCQEALTNVLKHAGPGPRVSVLLRFGEREVELGVDDDGRGLAAESNATDAGYGLTGMRERAALFGGSLTAGPRPGGGFRVRLTVPVPPPTAAPAPSAPTSPLTTEEP
ncbi:sensor histidine kinase [Antribacter gilvus]|uniref:sensor histidine kinase n=1 Tax=Antribacter gilvus TaxID=2304675 RepID=UPI000F7AF49F|nr:histidine kinase [Antribacter gilvus]